MAVNEYIAGQQLDNHIYWVDRWNYDWVVEQESFSVGGKIISRVNSPMDNPYGQLVTFKSYENSGWQKISTMKQIRLLSDALYGGDFQLVYDGNIYRAKFVYSNTGGAVQFVPVIRTATSDDHWCIATIYMRLLEHWVSP